MKAATRHVGEISPEQRACSAHDRRADFVEWSRRRSVLKRRKRVLIPCGERPNGGEELANLRFPADAP